MSQVNAEVEQIRHDIAAQQDEATKKVNELLQHLEERRVAAKREADELVGQAKNTRDQADSYAASKREEADIQAAAIVHKAGEEADAQIEERRAAAQSELDGLSKRIADLQERESVITQRVSELRSMFSQAFSGFAFGGNAAASGQDQEAAAAAALPVVAPVPEVKPVHNEADDQPGELSGNESLPTITMRQMRHRLIRLIRLIRLRRMSSPNRLSRPSTRHRANRRPRLRRIRPYLSRTANDRPSIRLLAVRITAPALSSQVPYSFESAPQAHHHRRSMT